MFPGNVSDNSIGIVADGEIKPRYLFRESSSTKTPGWHGPFGRRITFMNNFVINAKTDLRLARYGSNKTFHMGLNFRFSGNLFFGDYSSKLIIRDGAENEIGNFNSELGNFVTIHISSAILSFFMMLMAYKLLAPTHVKEQEVYI